MTTQNMPEQLPEEVEKLRNVLSDWVIKTKGQPIHEEETDFLKVVAQTIETVQRTERDNAIWACIEMLRSYSVNQPMNSKQVVINENMFRMAVHKEMSDKDRKSLTPSEEKT